MLWFLRLPSNFNYVMFIRSVPGSFKNKIGSFIVLYFLEVAHKQGIRKYFWGVSALDLARRANYFAMSRNLLCDLFYWKPMVVFAWPEEKCFIGMLEGLWLVVEPIVESGRKGLVLIKFFEYICSKGMLLFQSHCLMAFVVAFFDIFSWVTL